MKNNNQNLIIVIVVILVLLLFGGFGMMGFGNYGMMSGYNPGFMFFGWIFNIVIFIFIILGVYWLIKYLENNKRRK